MATEQGFVVSQWSLKLGFMHLNLERRHISPFLDLGLNALSSQRWVIPFRIEN